MQKRYLLSAILAATLFTIGCNKLDTTPLGSDLVTVDNINTFSREFPVITTPGIFNNTNDSTIIRKTENHVIGNIGLASDSKFGKTESAVYVQFKPTFYPFYFGNAGDTVRSSITPLVGLDSAFICLSYKGAWGDTATATSIEQRFEVRAISDNNFKDTPDVFRRINYKPSVNGTLIGFVNVKPQSIAKRIYLGRGIYKDSIENVIRIPLNAYGLTLFNQDTINSNNGFLNDSIFRAKFNGFEIKSVTDGNTLFYVNLNDAKSRIEFNYRRKKNNLYDTLVQSFPFYSSTLGTTASSSSANYIKRDYTGTPLLTNTSTSDDLFIQTAPGTYANISIPGLNSFKDTNRIINRAYLIVEQNDGTATPNIFTPPPYLYMDLIDTVANRFKPVYFDLSEQYAYNPDATYTNPLYHPYPSGNVDVGNFGGIALKRDDAGNTFYRYEFNITRYVQHIVTNKYYNYNLRLYSPYNYFYNQYPGSQYVIPFYNQLALGRVRVGSGNISPTNTHRMKFVVIYSLPK